MKKIEQPISLKDVEKARELLKKGWEISVFGWKKRYFNLERWKMERFGEYLRNIRKSASLTQESLGAKIEVSAAYIHQLETGKIAPPTEKRCKQLAWALSAPFSELWERARLERLANWAYREGIEDVFDAAPGDILPPLSEAERALIKLVRSLDGQTRKEFNGLVVMLLRHHAKEDIRRRLEDFLKKCA